MIDHFAADTAPLHCEPAAAAILVLDDGRYVLQLRDNIPAIFFPGHWGAFGGGIHDGETPLDALRRELAEELELAIGEADARYFTRIDFDLSFLGRDSVPRWFYEVEIPAARFATLHLREGAKVEAFTGAHALTRLRLTPYDAFALWLHWSRARLS